MFIMVPTGTRHNELTFRERVALGLVLYRNRVKEPCSIYFLNSRGGFDYRTCRKLVSRLTELNLVEAHPSTGQLVAVEPTGGIRGWFVWKSDEVGCGWSSRMRRWRLDLSSSLPLNVAGVYGLMDSLSKGKGEVRVSARRLSLIMGSSISSVRTSIKRLQADGLITSEPSRSGHLVKFTGQKPTTEDEVKTIKVNVPVPKPQPKPSVDPAAMEREEVRYGVGELCPMPSPCSCMTSVGAKFGRWYPYTHGKETEETKGMTARLDLEVTRSVYRWTCRACLREDEIHCFSVSGRHGVYLVPLVDTLSLLANPKRDTSKPIERKEQTPFLKHT